MKRSICIVWVNKFIYGSYSDLFFLLFFIVIKTFLSFTKKNPPVQETKRLRKRKYLKLRAQLELGAKFPSTSRKRIPSFVLRSCGEREGVKVNRETKILRNKK